GMSAMDSQRVGMGSGVMQMTFNIPAALGMALATSVIGTRTASKIGVGLDNRGELRDLATQYAHTVKNGNLSQANHILAALPNDSAEAIRRAAVSASSAAITTSMLVLAAVALMGAVFAWVIIGRQRMSPLRKLSAHPPVLETPCQCATKVSARSAGRRSV